jgi:STE24 endopeptidase
VSDALVQHMTLGEIRAVVAHEFGHIKNHHLWGNLAISLVYFWVLVAVVVMANAVAVIRDAPPVLKTLGTVVGLIFGYILLFGRLFREFEFAADRFAADVAGWKSCASALGKLGRLNATPARWTRWHGRLMTHPSMEERIRAVATQGFRTMNYRLASIRVDSHSSARLGRKGGSSGNIGIRISK